MTNHQFNWSQVSNVYNQERVYAPYSAPVTPKKIIGYYPAWGKNMHEIDATKLTHINYAFANIKDGTVVLGYPELDLENFKKMHVLKQKNLNLKLLISVGGGTWSEDFSSIAFREESREILANSTIAFIRKFGFDGIDIDWEFPGSGAKAHKEDKQNFTLLLKKIREKLNQASREDQKQYLLTAAVGAGLNHIANIEVKAVAKYVDWLNIMTYDYNGKWQSVSGHNAPLYPDPKDFMNPNYNIATTVQNYLSEGIPPSQLVLGIPFYGRAWTQCCLSDYGQYQYCYRFPKGKLAVGIYEFNDLHDNYINKNGYYRMWNSVAKVPYLFNPLQGTFISYDDEESNYYKMQYLKEKCLSGVMIWELSQDKDNILLNDLYQKLYY
ncbi:glycoside hydrolase family 18 protein [Bacillus wiedmannii]|uniref:glycoside hydrolase family 18 protein n=1 Tax=Bacillus wiedmannii TaxID=1890302 RepID=UPI000BF09080|nr:glycoside hydrolase family 18 protein [Bacillus wiedmannii]PEJ72528.1 hypothetical protein CN685_12075 [Bacillus wiedmannii]